MLYVCLAIVFSYLQKKQTIFKETESSTHTLSCRHHFEPIVTTCAKCHVLVCRQCIITSHSGHKFVDLAYKASQSKEHAQTLRDIAKKHRAETEKRSQSLNKKLDDFTKTQSSIVDSILSQESKIHISVNKSAKQNIALANRKTDECIKELQRASHSLKECLEKQDSYIKKCDDIIGSKDGIEVIRLAEELDSAESINVSKTDARDDISLPTFTPGYFQNKDIAALFGGLQNGQTDKAFADASQPFAHTSSLADVNLASAKKLTDGNIVASFKPKSRDIVNIILVDDDKAWIRGRNNKTIRMYARDGKLLTEETNDTRIFDMAYSQEGFLYLSCNQAPGSIYKCSENGKVIDPHFIKTAISTEHGRIAFMEPQGIAVSQMTGNIFVAWVDAHVRIIEEGCARFIEVYDRDGNAKYRIKNQDGKHMFSQPIRIRVNGINGDLLLVNLYYRYIMNTDFKYAHKTFSDILVLTGKGKYKFRYRGISDVSGFWPNDACFDSQSNIVVSDNDQEEIHILDCHGQFQRLVKTFKDPFALAIDTKDEIWMGYEGKEQIRIVRFLE